MKKRKRNVKSEAEAACIDRRSKGQIESGQRRYFLLDKDSKGQGTGKVCGDGRMKMATIGVIASLNNGAVCRDPRVAIGLSIKDALDPVKAPSKCRSLKDMTPEEREKILEMYQGKRTK